MKKIFACFLATLLFTTCFSQRRAYESKSYDYYMIKSQHLKTTGWILLGSGVGMMTVGIVLIANDVNNTSNNYNNNDDVSGKALTGAILFSAGFVASIGSIPLLVIGGVMHKKAMRASAFLNVEKVPDSRISGIPLQPFPALGVRINL